MIAMHNAFGIVAMPSGFIVVIKFILAILFLFFYFFL